MASVLLGRIKSRTEEVLSEAKARFRPGCSTIDQLFTLRLLAEKFYEFGKDLYISILLCWFPEGFFDSVSRKGLWHVMRHLGYDIKIIRLLESMYHNTVKFTGRAIKFVRDTRWGFTRLRPLASTVQYHAGNGHGTFIGGRGHRCNHLWFPAQQPALRGWHCSPLWKVTRAFSRKLTVFMWSALGLD